MVYNDTHSYNTPQNVDIIDFNLYLLDQIQPEVMNTRGDMIGKLRTFLEYIRDHGHVTMYRKVYTGVSLRKLISLRGGSVRTWEKYIHTWIEWGLLGRPDHSVSRNNIIEENMMEFARLNGYPYTTTMYTVTRWTAEQLTGLQRIGGTGTKANAIHRRGQAAADDIWGDRRRISPAQQRAEEKILDTISAEIAARGYCTRDALRNIRVYYVGEDGKRERIKIDPVFDAMRPAIDQEYHYGPPSAEIREQLHRREWIITAKDNAPDAPPKAREAQQ